MKQFIFALSLFFITNYTQAADIERRAAIDIGSGGTKVLIADVDLESNQIVEVLYDHSYPVAYQASIDKSSDGTFDSETKDLGLRTFKQIKEISDKYQVQKIVAVATSAFRKANNSRDFVAQVKKEADISITIISQREEGEIAFFSAIATNEFDPHEVVVWDIGTGSLQITTENESQNLTVYMGENMGSVPFKYYIMDVIQDRDTNSFFSPNPISNDHLKQADSYARAFGRKAYPIIKEKIKQQRRVAGIGRLFFNSIRPLASENGIITRKALRAYISSSLDKDESDLNNPFAHVDVTNCILTLAIMKSLHIHEIYPVDTTSTKGLMVSPAYWQ